MGLGRWLLVLDEDVSDHVVYCAHARVRLHPMGREILNAFTSKIVVLSFHAR